jgi:hypothetical protein
MLSFGGIKLSGNLSRNLEALLDEFEAYHTPVTNALPYCGISKVPRNKRRGTPAECARSKQIRYWGLVKIPPSSLIEQEDPYKVLQKESKKLRKIEDNLKILLKDGQKLKLIIEAKHSQHRKTKTEDKKLEAIRKKRDRLFKQLSQQQEIIANLNELLV